MTTKNSPHWGFNSQNWGCDVLRYFYQSYCKGRAPYKKGTFNSAISRNGEVQITFRANTAPSTRIRWFYVLNCIAVNNIDTLMRGAGQMNGTIAALDLGR